MGAYLSEPLTTKNSEEIANEYLASGSSSMQGWRVSQEDAHNCILNFDKNTSFFAVYDGHGGAEVAIYCSQYLPDFLKKLETYKGKEFEKALKEAFLGFDATLLSDKVIAELKRISDHNDKIMDRETGDDDEEDEDEYDNVADLYKEATMPLNEVLEKYKDGKGDPNDPKNKIKAILAGEKDPGKILSPFLKGKRRQLNSKFEEINEAGAGPSSSSSGINVGASSSSSSSSSAPTSSSPSLLSKKQLDVEQADSTVSSSSSNKKAVDDSKENQEPTSTNSGALDEPAVVETTEENQINEITDTAGNTNGEEASSKSKEDAEVPDSSSCNAIEIPIQSDVQKVVNGNHQELDSTTTEKKEAAEGVSSSSSSSTAQPENGEISSNTNSLTVDSSSSLVVAGKNGLAAIYDSDDDDDDDDSDDENYPQMDQGSSDDDDDDEDKIGGGDDSDEDEEEEDEDGEFEEEEDYLNAEDEEFMSSIVDEPGKDSGCTAVVALLHEKDLYVANAGDSRCVVCRSGRALEMSFDHKPEDQIEFDRIKNAGGRVTLDGRVNGGLNLSRAIGDHGYKMNKSLPADQQMISALPDIKHIKITPEDEFMVLACDGIWNFMTSDDVVEFVQERIKKNMKMSLICEEMFDFCLAPHTKGDGTGCDNMTAIIVQFKPNFTSNIESTSSTRKRAASPTVVESREEAAEQEPEPEPKKIKTMEDEAAAVVVDTSE